MSDPTQFIVNLSTVHRLLIHEGVIAMGRDFLTQKPCSIHSYVDQHKRTYTMQLFDSVDSDFVSNKLSSLAKSSHATSLPNLIRPCILTTRKTAKNQYQLAVLYDTQGFSDEVTLASLIKNKRNSNEKFEPDELSAFFWQLADFLLLSCKNSSQYLDISPRNIYCKIDGFYGYNFFLSNQGRSSKIAYHNPNDQFYKGQKNHQSALSAAMFSFGMVLLQLSTMLPTSELYSNGAVNEKALLKRMQGAKITSDRMISTAIGQLLELNETKRLKPTEIFKNQEWLKLRKVSYFQSKIDFFEYRNFEGIVEYDQKTSIGQALDKDLAMLRGTFLNGVFEGRGVRERGNTLQAGVFMVGQLTQGQIIQKNSHTDLGKFKNGSVQTGIRLFLNISNISKEGRNLVGFSGEFEGGNPKSGHYIYSDGSEQFL